MTEKLFDNSALLEFEATVTSVREEDGDYWVTLDRSAFAPDGGGQLSDIGTIGNVNVLDVAPDGGDVFHICDGKLEVGARVVCKIDKARRMRHLQNHTGEHIVSGIIFKEYGFNNVGFHLGSEETTMDVDGEISKDMLRRIERLANEAVAKNLEVKIIYPTQDELENMFYRAKLDLKENVRVVVIDGLDACACCAPHVIRTGEIGMIKLLYCQKYKGGTRIFLKCGFDALDEFNAQFDRATAISNMISEPRENIDTGVKKLLDDIGNYKHSVYELKKKVLSMKIESAEPKNGRLVFVDDDMDMGELRSFVASKLDACEKLCAAFSGNDEDGYTYVVGYKGDDFNEFIKNRISTLGAGGGGGKPPFAQGKVKCKKINIDTLWLD